MIDPNRFIAALWAVWLVVWLLAGLWSARAVVRQSATARYLHAMFTGAGTALLFFRSRGAGPWGALLPRSAWIGWIGAGLTLAGLLFTGWARGRLGPLWSATVTLKEGHAVVRSGPYALTRHPIYTGILAAVIGTVAARDTVAAIAGAALIAIGFGIKIRQEEDLLIARFGAEYRDYREKVPALIPRLW